MLVMGVVFEQLMDINESPIYILLNPAINHAQKDLPITLFESGMFLRLLS
jgi:COP9 signalosome complex subunit 6